MVVLDAVAAIAGAPAEDTFPFLLVSPVVLAGFFAAGFCDTFFAVPSSVAALSVDLSWQTRHDKESPVDSIHVDFHGAMAEWSAGKRLGHYRNAYVWIAAPQEHLITGPIKNKLLVAYPFLKVKNRQAIKILVIFETDLILQA